ncbi:hypothetical protein BDU57DRAFT_59849 [Ampelomyces quisqualis]|uniref:Uncharacterized protein n=1 Tax=Ampelomyces quisqualis TaxID=50730 RepID=A0A6A5R0W9_AMPQU|nr:hypothetical protein BDU57DRAFT_59849 [Ampelomyces quisqualis]
MTTTTDTRGNWRSWSVAFETAPPAACQTLRNERNVLEWGKACVFGEEDGDPLPFSINTACMPWVTPNVYPSSGAFYSPATACPTSWSAVSTATSGDQWVSGETALTCCPPGFEGDARGGCRVGSSGTYPVIQCGEADAEENNNFVYTAGQFPASATPSITALQIRYQASDTGSASAPASSPSNSGSGSSNDTGGGGGGLSTGAKAAIGTIIPLVFIISALAFGLLWRTRKQKKAAMALAAQNMAASPDAKGAATLAPGGATAYRTSDDPHETPEWNVEMDATEAEKQKLVAHHDHDPTSAGIDASELGGMVRMSRKPIAPVEIDGTAVRAEVGDAYIPYRAGGGGL